MEDVAKINVCSHPLIQQALGELRKKETPPAVFQARIAELSRYLTYEAAKDLPVRVIPIETPLCATTAVAIDEPRMILAPILRAGLTMLEGAMATFPHAQVRHIGLYRDEVTLEPVEYYLKLPGSMEPTTLVMVLDPMLATGGSACAALRAFRERGIQRLRMICLIAAPEGIDRVHQSYPDVPIYCAAVDERLNEHAYIVPGLGDCGDRAYGTT
jgi:uracil phosphoribosyltransferase